MRLHAARLAVLAIVAVTHPCATAPHAPVIAELDAYWAEVSRTTAEGDFAGMQATYHPSPR